MTFVVVPLLAVHLSHRLFLLTGLAGTPKGVLLASDVGSHLLTRACSKRTSIARKSLCHMVSEGIQHVLITKRLGEVVGDAMVE